jgi:lysophospholipase
MGSLYANDFPNIRGLVEGTGDGHEGWLLDIPLVTPDGDNIFSDLNQYYYGSVLWSVVAKGDTGV